MLKNLKTLQELQLEPMMKEYISKNNGSVYSEAVKEFIRNCQQNRDVMCHYKPNQMNPTPLSAIKTVTVNYLKQIGVLKGTVAFDKPIEAYKFSWLDSVSKTNVSSNSFEFEYYNTLFNLGMIYFQMGRELSQEADGSQEKSKQLVKTYRYAAGIFDKIKNEASMSLGKDLPSDLTPIYMNFCSKLSIAFGQVKLIRYLENQTPNYGLLAKLAKGMCTLFDDLIQIASKDCANYLEAIINEFLSNRRLFWEGMLYLYLKEEALTVFNKNGKEYGTAMAYAEFSVTKLAECGENIDKFQLFFKVTEYYSLFSKEKAQLEDMKVKNNKIYHFTIPNVIGNTYEGLVKVEPSLPSELTDGEEHQCLQDLIPINVQEMLSKYKVNIIETINPILNDNENEIKIDYFLKSQKLADSFFIRQSDKITDELWQAIEGVQEKGGYAKLVSSIESIRLKSLEIERKINESLTLLHKESQDDLAQSNSFGANWYRDPSQKLNSVLVQQLNKCLSEIMRTREYDNQAKKDIQQCETMFETLSYTRTLIEERIPLRDEQSKANQTKEAIELKKAIDQLLELKPKCTETIKSIFDYLNSPIIQKQFLDISLKRENEANVLKQNQREFDFKLDQLKVLSKQVKIHEEEIKQKKEAFDKIFKIEDVSVTNAKEKYKNELSSSAALYHKKYLAIFKGLSYYTDLESKINALIDSAHQFVSWRNEEKVNLINYLTKGIPFPSEPNKSNSSPMSKYLPTEGYLNPQTNIYTQMNVKSYNSNLQQPQYNPHQPAQK